LLLLLAIPLFNAQEYFLHVLGTALIFAIAALGMQLLLGYAGQLSIGQAAFLGVGAYTSGILTVKLQLPFIVAFPLSGTVAAVTSLLLVPITRLKGVYLAVATLGFTIVVHLIFQNEEWLTGGTFGLMGIPHPAIGSFTFSTSMHVYYLCLFVLVAVYCMLSLLVTSRFGRALRAIMADEDAARASGINPTLYKSKCFIIAAFITGLSGSLLAHHSLYLNPNDFTFWKSIEILIMTAVGGIGSLPGAVVGAMVITILPEYLRAVDEYRMIIYGGALVILMGVGKNGLAGLSHSLAKSLLTRIRRVEQKLPEEVGARP